MKIDFVEFAGFRGFREHTRFDFAAGFVVLTGRNGAGKSTVLDAIDFAVTGSINKYQSRNARGGGLDEHIWWVGNGKPLERYVSVGFIADTGERFVVSRDHRSKLSDSARASLDKLYAGKEPSLATLMSTTLIRDESITALSIDQTEQARFEAVREAIGTLVGPDYSARLSEILAEAVTFKELQDERLHSLQAELSRSLGALTEARAMAERSASVADALKIIEGLGTTLPDDPAARREYVRGWLASRRIEIEALTRQIDTAETLTSELALLESSDATAKLAEQRADLENSRAALELAREQLATVQVEQELEQTDEFAVHLAALVEHGSAVGLQHGHCPLCDAARSSSEFEVAITKAREILSGRDQTLKRLADDVSAALAKESELAGRVESLTGEINLYEFRQQHINIALASVDDEFKKYSLEARARDPQSARQQLLPLQERIATVERALFILESSSAVDRVSELQERVSALRLAADTEGAKAALCERAVASARQIQAGAKTVANQILAEQFDTVMPLLKELYRRLRPHGEWREIDSDFGGKVRGSLNFTVGDGRNLQFLFSSGQRRAAGLAFLLSIHLSRRWSPWRSLLLDDPVQHVDDYRALNLVEVLSAIRRTGRQVVVAVEDNALADLLCRKLRSSIDEPGRRFELKTSKRGSAEIAEVRDILPMPRQVLKAI